MKWLFFIFLLLSQLSAGAESLCLDSLKIATWNTKHLGRDTFDYESAVKLIRMYDLIALQEVNTSESGELALKSLRTALFNSTKEKWCYAISATPSGSKERYAYLWRSSKVSFVSNGRPIDCDETKLQAELATKYEKMIVREPAVATFFSKKEQLYFRYANVHLVPKMKSPEKEVPYLFKSFDNEKYLTIIGGDFNLSSGHKVFDDIKLNNWKNILPDDTKTSLKAKDRTLNMAYDNLWLKSTSKQSIGCESQFEVNNSYTSLPSLSIKHIYNKISDHAPANMNYFFKKSKRSIASEQKLEQK
jgi:endonuclease/exonuclease/phosphatase family metal-dependent hydrolase